MNTDLSNSILKKLYDRYFENFVVGFSRNALEDEFSNHNPNDVRIVLNKLIDDFLISLVNNYYKITVFGIKYLEEEELVDSTKHHDQRNKIIRILKEAYEKDASRYVFHETIVKKLNLAGPGEILAEMKYLNDEGYIELQMYLGGSFDARLTSAGYELSKSI